MADPHAFPQDWATGLNETVDWNDAGSFANLRDHPNIRQHVVEGFEFDVSDAFDSGILRIGPGKAMLYQASTFTNDHREDNGPDEKELVGATFVGQQTNSGDITLVDNSINYIFVAIDQTDNDGTFYASNTENTAPAPPSLRIGWVDTANDTYVEENRLPTVSARRMRVSGPTFGGDY